MRKAGEPFLHNLDAITIEDLWRSRTKPHVLEDEKATADFAI